LQAIPSYIYRNGICEPDFVLMNSPNLNFITDQAQILKCLTESFHRGNVIGITSEVAGHTLFLTCVENIFESGVTGQKMIALKKFDVNGIIHENNCIPLIHIDRVQSFQSLYKDSLRKTFRTIVSENESVQKVRRLESFISTHDLRIILIKMLDTPQRIYIKLSNKGTDLVEGYIKDIDPKFEKIVVSSGVTSPVKKEIKLIHIESIQFEKAASTVSLMEFFEGVKFGNSIENRVP
jgi:hypothetical protein